MTELPRLLHRAKATSFCAPASVWSQLQPALETATPWLLREATSAGEPLDRWSGDGITAPADRDDLVRRERTWDVDFNDGVRVNVAPLQLAGLLADAVLAKDADARKAIADRARWRSDERRWVRDGVLPRCGWMHEDIPESPRWTERAPEREAERLKLEAKRAEALRKLEHGNDR